jgi:hypothetical protein
MTADSHEPMKLGDRIRFRLSPRHVTCTGTIVCILGDGTVLTELTGRPVFPDMILSHHPVPRP